MAEFEIIIKTDANYWIGPTLKERYEPFYGKLIEIRNIFLAKKEAETTYAGDFNVYLGKQLADINESKRTYLGANWCDLKMWQDNDLLPNEAVVECKLGKAKLIVENLVI